MAAHGSRPVADEVVRTPDRQPMRVAGAGPLSPQAGVPGRAHPVIRHVLVFLVVSPASAAVAYWLAQLLW
jgi:hypothetical protein